MNFFQWLSSGYLSANLFIGLVIILAVIFIIAFIQGRELSIWPPRVGEKPERKKLTERTTSVAEILEQAVTIPPINNNSTSIHVRSNNDLDKGIRIGGMLDGNPLKLIASDWMRFQNLGWVTSGWLYANENSSSQAITFFKIHLWDKGDGYIHIMDVANPKHKIWFETTTQSRREEEFCWDNEPKIQRTNQWQFTWQK